MTIENVVRDFLNYQRISKREGTMTFNNSHCDRILYYCNLKQIINIEDLTENHVIDFIVWQLDNDNKNSTVNKRLGLLKRILKHYYKRNKKTISDELKNELESILELDKLEDDTQRYESLSEEDFIKFMSYIDSLDETTVLSLRDKVLFNIFFQNGVRRSEISNILISNINFNEQSIILPSSLTKTRHKRYLYFDDETKCLLLKLVKYNPIDNDYLFINYRTEQKLTPRGITSIVKEHSIESGVKVHPHMLRHTYATISRDMGMSFEHIQRVLGHTTLSTTLRYYHVRDKATQRAAAEFNPKKLKCRC